MTKGRTLGLMAATCLMAVAAQAEYSYWQGTSGGDLSNAANWSPSITRDRNYLNSAQTAPLTIAADFTGLYWPWFGGSGNYVLDLGGYTLTAAYRVHFDGGASAASVMRTIIKNGTFAVGSSGDKVFIGDGKGYNHITVESTATLRGSAQPIYVGDKTYWNSLTVNGTLEGQVYLANTKGGNNTLTVDGETARWNCSSAVRTIIGVGGSDNEVCLQNGAQATLGGSFDLANATGSSGNKAYVRSGATLTVAGEVNVGYQGPSNEISVEQGGTLNAKVMTSVYIGRQGSASGNVLSVSGAVNSDYENTSSTPIWYVGANTANNVLRVLPGGRVNISNANLYAANAAAASGNRIEVLGGELDAKRVIVGLKGTDSTMVVSNGVVKLGDTLDFNYDSGSARGRIVIEGADAQVSVASNIRLKKDATLEFRVPKAGFTSVPLKVNNMEAESDAKLVVLLADGELPSQDVVLLESAADLSEPSVQRIKQKLTVPEGAKIVFNSRSAVLKIRKGLAIIIR